MTDCTANVHWKMMTYGYDVEYKVSKKKLFHRNISVMLNTSNLGKWFTNSGAKREAISEFHKYCIAKRDNIQILNP